MAAPSTRNIVPLLPTAAPTVDYVPSKPIIITQVIQAVLRAKRF